MKRSDGSIFEVFRSFLKLGCIAFGGPVAHLGFFMEEFVKKRNWLSPSEFTDIVALCQFLPGPASSQVGFAIGLKRAGVPGAFAAWLAFTLPSAILMISFAMGLTLVDDLQHAGWLTGLKLAALAVVANAIWSMATKLCPDRIRALIALAGATLLLVMGSAIWQVLVIAIGSVVGWIYFKNTMEPGDSSDGPTNPVRTGWPFLAAFFVLLLGLPVLIQSIQLGWLTTADGFYRAGSLVFGGGHVVLPLLDTFTVGQGWVDQESFLAGYGAAQAMPGPLFSFTSFLGATISVGPGGIAGGLLALTATYLPSWLLVLGVMPYWDRLRQMPSARAALMGANAAVVGLLLAAFYNPIWTASITAPDRLAFALVAFGLLRFCKLPPWALVLACAACGALLY